MSNYTKEEIDINYNGIDFKVFYSYQPEEKAETGPEAQYPGCKESIDDVEISHYGIDFTDFLEEQMDEIKQLIWDKLKK